MKRVFLWTALWTVVLANPLFSAEGRRVEAKPEASKITIDVKATGDNFEATLENYVAEVSFAEGKEGLPLATNFEFDFKDLKTGNKKRDAEMLKWLEYNRFPKAGFKMSSWKKGQGSSGVAVGEFTLHGVSRSMEIPVELSIEGTKISARGEFHLNYTNYKLPIIRKFGFLTVNPDLRVVFYLEGKTSPHANH